MKVYHLPASRRTLSAYAKVLPLELGRQLKRWVGEGQYAAWFDHAHDNVTFAKFQTYDFARMKEFPDVVQPLMMYLMRRFRQRETEPGLSHALKVFAIDEAWKFLTTEESKGEIKDAVKTGGKNNLMVLLATQSIEDLEQSGIVAQLEDNCPTQLFVAVKQSTVPRLKRMFALTDREAEVLGTLQPKRDVLLKQTGRPSVKLRFEHSPKALARYRFQPHPVWKEVSARA